jgi:hypothetical protein
MKSCCLLLIGLFVVSCSKEEVKADAVKADAVKADAVQVAASKIDIALLTDYEQALKVDRERPSGRTMPALPDQLPEFAEDAAFLRRACIDLAGRLPRADEARAFLADASPDKRARLTDALLQEPGAVEVRYRMLAEAFRVKDDGELAHFLRRAAADDMPYDQIVATLIGGGLLTRRDGGVVLRTATEVSSSVLGIDMYCAMCHDHPYGDTTERQCYEFAACFAKKDGLEPVRLPRDYLYKDGTPGEVVKPRFLPRSGGLLESKKPRAMHKPDDLAKWIVSRDDERLATMAALRAWSVLFGKPGLLLNRAVGGVDATPAWHDVHPKPVNNTISSNCFGPPVRDYLPWNSLEMRNLPRAAHVMTQEFRQAGMRIGAFQRILARTAAYSRAGHAVGVQWGAVFLVPSPQIRRLPAEVLWSAVSDDRAVLQNEVPPAAHPLRLLGRGTREWADESCEPISHELVRFLMNSAMPPVSARDADTLFLEMLGRLPSAREKSAISDQQATPEDVAWSLVNSVEFLFRS